MAAKKATIKDVAALAQVSIKTVSRVINNEPSVGEKTKQRVIDAVDKLDYQPNLAARNLAATRTYALGFVYDNPNAYYIIDMQNGILSECRAKGYELVIHPCKSDSFNIVEELTNMVRRSQLAGIIISPPLSENAQLLNALEQQSIPFVRVISKGDETPSAAPCVMIDDRTAAFKITEHLIKTGHRNIGFLKGDASHMSSQQRELGFMDALNKHDIKCTSDYLIEGQFTFEFGTKGVNQLLDLSQRPTAIFACNDEIAAGALFAARLRGVNIPDQLAIAGFENSPFSRQTYPKITTAAQPTDEIAKLATACLIQHIKSDMVYVASSHESTTFTPELIVRESTYIASTGDA
ncbi:LacI family DNA-binding transcriptional regulator [Glaciecola siphonariae]|uniref:LacI family DNA-binding transcriptional regulator n=1 Tax=Glaciecola siphonariae TaxID=521012 RepID=A0ABV9LXQ9_9ALTE